MFNNGERYTAILLDLVDRDTFLENYTESKKINKKSKNIQEGKQTIVISD